MGWASRASQSHLFLFPRHSAKSSWWHCLYFSENQYDFSLAALYNDDCLFVIDGSEAGSVYFSNNTKMSVLLSDLSFFANQVVEWLHSINAINEHSSLRRLLPSRRRNICWMLVHYSIINPKDYSCLCTPNDSSSYARTSTASRALAIVELAEILQDAPSQEEIKTSPPIRVAMPLLPNESILIGLPVLRKRIVDIE